MQQWWNSVGGTVMVEQGGETVEQCLWNSVGYSGTVKVEQCGGTMGQCW